MGSDITSAEYSGQQRREYRQTLRQNLDLFESYLDRAEFITDGTIGLEVEMNLVDNDMQPACKAVELLEAIDREEFTHEIGTFNIEMNYPVLHPAGGGLGDIEEGLVERLEYVDGKAAELGCHLLPIGHLPTVDEDLLNSNHWRTPGNRYLALENAVLQSRGEDIHLEIAGQTEYVDLYMPSISPEAVCTSAQLHLQVAPEEFAPTWNAAQAIAGPQVALAANSPFLLGKRLWHETRIATFQQSIDTRPPEHAAQGIRPRVWFGERWITSMFDLFEENVRFFPPLLPESRVMAEQPMTNENAAPILHELVLHNGTVWRWNRPIYDPGSSLPHLRIENRLLPAGPTVLDMVANAAFFYGLMHEMIRERRPMWSRMSFAKAREHFYDCARYGLDTRVDWPRFGRVRVGDLLADELIPQAAEGMRALNIDSALVDRYTEVLTERARTGRNGARWQIDAVARLESMGANRDEALAEMTRLYRLNMLTSAPVHTWPLP